MRLLVELIPRELGVVSYDEEAIRLRELINEGADDARADVEAIKGAG